MTIIASKIYQSPCTPVEEVTYTDKYRLDNEMMCLECRWQGRMANFYIEDDGDKKV